MRYYLESMPIYRKQTLVVVVVDNKAFSITVDRAMFLWIYIYDSQFLKMTVISGLYCHTIYDSQFLKMTVISGLYCHTIYDSQFLKMTVISGLQKWILDSNCDQACFRQNDNIYYNLLYSSPRYSLISKS